MTDDVRAVDARIYHRSARETMLRARDHRAQRDRLIRQLRDEDPAHWTYERLGRAVGCSPELIAHIIRTGRGRE